MGKPTKGSKDKKAYYKKVEGLLTTYNKAFIVNCDNVGSRQLQQIRKAVRGSSTILFGKNTLIRKVIRGLIPTHPTLEKLLPCIKNNVGFVFTEGDLRDVRDTLLANRVPAAAKAGATAPCKVTVPAGNTGLDPGQTSFFQALNIPTRINKGAIEIINDVNLIEQDAKVNASEAALLQKLNIKPFSYGLAITNIFDRGTTYTPEVLDIGKDDIVKFIQGGIQTVASIGLATGMPNRASVPHMVINAFKNILAVAVQTDISLPQADKIKEYLADPGKFAAAAAPTTSAPAVSSSSSAAPAPAAEPEEEFSMGGLFD